MRLSIVFVVLTAIAVTVAAQNDAGSFHGRIVDADTRQTATETVTIVVTKEGESAATRSVIDVKGEFVLPDLTLGRYQIQFRYKGISTGTQQYLQVTGPASTTPADIYLRIPGEITGAVVDQDGEPVQGAQVQLVGMHYLAGQTVYTVSTNARPTDDRGQYSLSTRVEAGPYFLLVLPPEGTRATLSGTPSLEPVWYPGRPGLAQPFVIRSAEKKHLDFVLEKKKTYCVDGTLTANGQPAAKNFEIAIPEVAGYRGTTGGTQGVIVRGQSDASGRFQACGLWPGEFHIAAGMNSPGPGPQTVQFLFAADTYGHGIVSVVDRDVRDVKVNAQSSVSLAREIRVDNGTTLPQGTYRLSFTPLNRVAFESQPFMIAPVDVVAPSRFTVSLLPYTDYRVNLGRFDGSSDWYLKDVSCGGRTLPNSLQLGESDCGLRITVGTDIGKLTATVLDKDNKSDPNSAVCVASSSSITREEIALTGSCSSADRGTTSISIALRPDRYFAVVVPPTTADWVEYFLTNRGQGPPIDIKAPSTLQVTLKRGQGR